VKCKLFGHAPDDKDALYTGNIDHDPEEITVIIHDGMAFVFDGIEDEDGEEVAYYTVAYMGRMMEDEGKAIPLTFGTPEGKD
jgi:hypothetical protein